MDLVIPDLSVHADSIPQNQLVMGIKLRVGDECIASRLLPFAGYRDLVLQDPCLEKTWRRLESGLYSVMIKASRPAPWVWLTCDCTNIRCSDNFFPMLGGETRSIRVRLVDPADDVPGITDSIVLRSLHKTLTPDN